MPMLWQACFASSQAGPGLGIKSPKALGEVLTLPDWIDVLFWLATCSRGSCLAVGAWKCRLLGGGGGILSDAPSVGDLSNSALAAAIDISSVDFKKV